MFGILGMEEKVGGDGSSEAPGCSSLVLLAFARGVALRADPGLSPMLCTSSLDIIYLSRSLCRLHHRQSLLERQEHKPYVPEK